MEGKRDLELVPPESSNSTRRCAVTMAGEGVLPVDQAAPVAWDKQCHICTPAW